MTIDKSSDAWTSLLPADIGPYLVDLAIEEGTYPINQFRLAICACGSQEFRLIGDQDEGAAKRTCAACDVTQFICDGEDYWVEAVPEKLVCTVCKSDVFNLGVGFSLSSGSAPDVRWITVGERCVKCGTLGSFVDWKISYSPSMQLIDQV